MEISQLCVEAVCYPLISKERQGVEEIRNRAFKDMLEHQRKHMAESFFGQVKGTIIIRTLRTEEYSAVPRVETVINALNELAENAKDTMDIIRTVDYIYNNIFDRSFEKYHGTLEDVLNVTLDDLTEFDWKDYLEEEALEDMLQQYMNDIRMNITQLDMKDKPKQEIQESKGPRMRIIDEEAIKKLYSYVELNHGKTYLSELEQKHINYTICRGVHADCNLYYTDGILQNPAQLNYQYKYAQMQLSKNKNYYHTHHRIIKRNIEMLTDTLRKALIMRNEDSYCRAETGQLVPQRLWKLGRTHDTKFFDKIIKSDNSDFVVDILLDSSGSQSVRQPQVATQGYIISEALSNIGIPHRVMSFCTFCDYTIMHRFREYDDDRSKNSRIFEFFASSNNRDGLAIKATYDTLLNRHEDNKIMIVLSDGKPNDVKLNRPGTLNPHTYDGEFAIRDTAFEVRRARAFDIAVLGVFAGKEEDLAAEKRIFGKDFAYIRNISNFSHIVGTYLKKQLDNEMF
jgi:hypothetical protein